MVINLTKMATKTRHYLLLVEIMPGIVLIRATRGCLKMSILLSGEKNLIQSVYQYTGIKRILLFNKNLLLVLLRF